MKKKRFKLSVYTALLIYFLLSIPHIANLGSEVLQDVCAWIALAAGFYGIVGEVIVLIQDIRNKKKTKQ